MRGRLAERATGVAIITAKLDEKTWAAVDAVGELAWIHTPQIYDETTGEFYYEADFPIEIPVGNIINGRAWFTNLYSYQCTFFVTVEFIDPDANIVGRWYGAAIADPGEDFQKGSESIVINKAGMWKFHAKIED